jgi:hypothetical protein
MELAAPAIMRAAMGLILPCLDQPRQIVVEDAEPELLELLAAERDRVTDRIECLARNRDAIASYLDAVSEATNQRRSNTTSESSPALVDVPVSASRPRGGARPSLSPDDGWVSDERRGGR